MFIWPGGPEVKMIIRLRIDTGIDTREHAELIYQAIKDHADWFIPISSLEPNSLEIHLCGHDTNPNEPCTLWEQIIDNKLIWHEGEKVV